ncbi:MAG: HNH endonuclease [Chlorobiaceae bacterium]
MSVAIQQTLQSNLNNEFKRGDVRKLTGIKEGSFAPVFQAMSADQPGGAPSIKESLTGIIQKAPGQWGYYLLTDKGKTLLSTDFSRSSHSALDNLVQTSQSLENVSYFTDPSNNDQRRVLREIAQRQGQIKFRNALIKAYSSRCAVTGCDAAPALEAAHIRPYSGSHSNEVSNGLLLRADIHTLFDLNLLRINPKTYTVSISDDLKSTVFSCFEGAVISVPKENIDQPNKMSLTERWVSYG